MYRESRERTPDTERKETSSDLTSCIYVSGEGVRNVIGFSNHPVMSALGGKICIVWLALIFYLGSKK